MHYRVATVFLTDPGKVNSLSKVIEGKKKKGLSLNYKRTECMVASKRGSL